MQQHDLITTILHGSFEEIYQIDAIEQSYRTLDKLTMQFSKPNTYLELLTKLHRDIPHNAKNMFLAQMSLGNVLNALATTSKPYVVEYKTKTGNAYKYYELNINYLNKDSSILVMTIQDKTEYIQKINPDIANITKDSERFNFLIQNMCENFAEVDIKTGVARMVNVRTGNIIYSTLKEQIQWFAANVIAKDEVEGYVKTFEFDNLMKILTERDGFATFNYTAIYEDGKHYLVIVCALFKDNNGGGHIFSYAQDITQLKQQEEQNRQLINISQQLLNISQRDVLTGVYNRAAGEAHICELLAQKEFGTLFILDIDYFKNINDSYGHNIGDFVLKYFCKTIKEYMNAEDILCRWGGDEFILYMPNVIEKNIVRNKINAVSQKLAKCNIDGINVQITISVGAITTCSSDVFAELFTKADEMLYKVKKEGRNGLAIYNNVA